jgi:hypothetical protein
MPIPAFGTDQPAAICCDNFFTITQQAALIAGEAVRNCFGETCSELSIGVTHAEPVGGGDYVVAWLSSIVPPAIQAGKNFFPVSRLNISVVVCLSGFPRIEVQGGDLTPLADLDEYTHAAYFSYGAMESAYRAVVKQLVASPDSTFGGCTVAGLSNLFPQPPASGHVRWSFTVFLDYRT